MNKSRDKKKIKKRKQKRGKKGKQQMQNRTQRTHTPGTAAAVKYFFATTQPWNSPAVGLPLEPAMQSSKQKFWSKGRVETGLLGIGFIVGNGGWCSDIASLHVTSPLFNGQSIQTSAVGVEPFATNSPYTVSQLSPGNGSAQLQIRLVATGLRIRYIGTELNRGGRVLSFEHPDHNTIVGYDATQVLGFPDTSFEPVDRKWHSAHWSHKWPGEEDYDVNCEPRAGPGDAVGSHPTYGMIIEAADAAVSAVFEYEYYVLVEIIGSPVANISSPSVSHNQKTNTLKSKISQVTPKVKSALGRLPVKRIENTAVNILSKEDPAVGAVAKSAEPILNTLAPMAFSLM